MRSLWVQRVKLHLLSLTELLQRVQEHIKCVRSPHFGAVEKKMCDAPQSSRIIGYKNAKQEQWSDLRLWVQRAQLWILTAALTAAHLRLILTRIAADEDNKLPFLLVFLFFCLPHV